MIIMATVKTSPKHFVASLYNFISFLTSEKANLDDTVTLKRKVRFEQAQPSKEHAQLRFGVQKSPVFWEKWSKLEQT